MNFTKIGVICILLYSNILGASIDHIQNYTTEYNANPAQQGALSKSASVYFNPAGIVNFKEGIYYGGGLQLGTGKETMEYTKKTGDKTKNTYNANLIASIPDFSIYKIKRNKGYFLTLGPQGGGGKLKYKNGVSGIKILEDFPDLGLLNPKLSGFKAKANSHFATGENMYFQGTFGIAWKVSENWSLSTAGKIVYGYRRLNASLDATLGSYPLKTSIDSERNAWGFGGQLGLNYILSDTWNIGMRYDTPIKMKFKTKATSKTTIPGFGFEMFFPQYANNKTYRRDLSGIIALGASQKINEKLTAFYGGNYYLNESANIDRDIPEHSFEYKNGWDLSLGIEYQIDKKLSLISGINYAKTGAKTESYSDVEFALDSFSIGLGFKYLTDEENEIILSVNHYFYVKDSNDKYPGITNLLIYDKNISSVGVSFSKKL